MTPSSTNQPLVFVMILLSARHHIIMKGCYNPVRFAIQEQAHDITRPMNCPPPPQSAVRTRSMPTPISVAQKYSHHTAHPNLNGRRRPPAGYTHSGSGAITTG